MRYTQEQLVLGAREAARGMLEQLGRGGAVARFVDRYVAAHERRGLKDSPLRYKELLATIIREALLAAVAELFARLPERITGRKKTILTGQDAEAVELFRVAFLNALVEFTRWTPPERDDFRDDLELYARMAARLSSSGRRPKVPTEGPFVDRCALLLDPSLLEKARIAAGRFQLELERIAEEMLDVAFGKKGKRVR
jgi:hypothetical protein